MRWFRMGLALEYWLESETNSQLRPRGSRRSKRLTLSCDQRALVSFPSRREPPNHRPPFADLGLLEADKMVWRVLICGRDRRADAGTALPDLAVSQRFHDRIIETLHNVAECAFRCPDPLQDSKMKPGIPASAAVGKSDNSGSLSWRRTASFGIDAASATDGARANLA